ncbi:uncharacterized protein LOC125538945 isoform X2 [Triticum urartu]|uniref:uncharacterized protein LOC125517422 isoform X2 n=1 Tax=Triticum urartu TaxID=4572 RepID=UPI002043FA6F|nr:uncharacterized protein LOC125517422 isoform X2 [Triticum urartu]XP_048558217.1 uncharacterized protein LOC125538945 isoform X2 [Triticum urartu]
MCGRGEKEDWDAGIISRHRRASATAATLASTDDAMEQAWFPDDTVSSCKHVQFCPWILHPLCASSLDTTLPLLQPQLAPMTPCMQQVKMRGERAQNGIRHHLGTPLFCCCDPTTDDAMEQVKFVLLACYHLKVLFSSPTPDGRGWQGRLGPTPLLRRRSSGLGGGPRAALGPGGALQGAGRRHGGDGAHNLVFLDLEHNNSEATRFDADGRREVHGLDGCVAADVRRGEATARPLPLAPQHTGCGARVRWLPLSSGGDNIE